MSVLKDVAATHPQTTSSAVAIYMKDILCFTPHSTSNKTLKISFTARGKKMSLTLCGQSQPDNSENADFIGSSEKRTWNDDYSKAGKVPVSTSNWSGQFLHCTSCLFFCLIWTPGTSLGIVKAGHNNTGPLIRTTPENSNPHLLTLSPTHTHKQLALIMHKNKAWSYTRQKSQGQHVN